jgi:ATP phosphoribosyltransferase regulatory subunit
MPDPARAARAGAKPSRHAMNDLEHRALLPTGLRDMLPPDAAFEAEIVERLVAFLGARGFQRVKPPLVEFESSLLTGAGVAVSPDTFRLMDPVSQRMMGVRADITPQIARIALSRLSGEPRPLRLSYAGEVLRVRGTQLRPERQFVQVGAELIGASAPRADAEIIVTAAEALGALGVSGLSVDLTVPRLVPGLFQRFGLAGEDARAVRAALDRKDTVAVAAQAGAAAPVLTALLAATGGFDKAFETLSAAALPEEAARERDRVGAIAALIREAAPALRLTLDPVEHRGFEYHTGIGFTVFADGVRGELAGGGRYRARSGDDDSEGERATGFTLYVDTILRTLTSPAPPRRVLLPVGAAQAVAEGLRADGWVTVAALDDKADPVAEARRLGCGFVLDGASPSAVEG